MVSDCGGSESVSHFNSNFCSQTHRHKPSTPKAPRKSGESKLTQTQRMDGGQTRLLLAHVGVGLLQALTDSLLIFLFC